MRFFKLARGFTLMELLIAVAIIGILFTLNPHFATAAPAEPDVGLDRSAICDSEQQSTNAKTASINLDDLDYGKNATGLAPAIYDDTLAATGDSHGTLKMSGIDYWDIRPEVGREVMRVGVMQARQIVWPDGGDERDISAGGYVIIPPAMAFNKRVDYGLGAHASG